MLRGATVVFFLVALVVIGFTAPAGADDRLQIVNLAEFKWKEWAPGCEHALFPGDPEKEASHRIARCVKGFVFPKHWHVNGENVAVISGSIVIAEEGREVVLREGGYLHVPPKNVHWGSCPDGCLFYVGREGPDSFFAVEEKK